MSLRGRELRVEGTMALLAVLAVALVILGVGLYLGPRVFLDRGGAPWTAILPTTFAAWESRAPGEHLFLAFITPEDLAAGKAYDHYPQPLLFFYYLCLQPFRWLGIPYERSYVWLSLPQLAVILLLLGVHLRDRRPLVLWPARALPLLRWGVLVVAVAAVVTLPSFWVTCFRFVSEGSSFLPALAFCHLAAADYRGTLRGRDAVWTLVPIALFAPVFTPFLTASWLLLWGIGSDQREPIDWRGIGGLAAVTALGGIVLALPTVLGHLGSMINLGSGVRFRSGLDGSEQYFTSMAQALWAPSYAPGRPWQLWQWPIAAFAAIAATTVQSRALAARMVRQLFLSWVPLLWLVIVFPQLVSIHPYYTDFHIAFGAAFCLAFWLPRPEFEGWSAAPALRLAILMVFSALLMTNLIDLARLARAPIE
jgi:hypothetical protein